MKLMSRMIVRLAAVGRLSGDQSELPSGCNGSRRCGRAAQDRPFNCRRHERPLMCAKASGGRRPKAVLRRQERFQPVAKP
jgi:hypothetical protein